MKKVVRVPKGEQTQIQDILFSKGYYWCSGERGYLKHVHFSWLYLYRNGEMAYSDRNSNVLRNVGQGDASHITWEQMLALEDV